MVDAAKQLLIELLTSFVWLFWRVRGEWTHNSVARASAQPGLVKAGRKLTPRAHVYGSAREGWGSQKARKWRFVLPCWWVAAILKTLPQRNRL